MIISPYSKKLRNGKKNPKNYPNWQRVIDLLRQKGIHVIQVGRSGEGEDAFNVDELKFDLSYEELEQLVKDCDTWACVDNFFHHMCSFIPNKKGVVVWGKSNPSLFGYAHNTNLLKDKKYLRANQFDIWEHEDYSSKCWSNAEIVVQAIMKIIANLP